LSWPSTFAIVGWLDAVGPAFGRVWNGICAGSGRLDEELLSGQEVGLSVCAAKEPAPGWSEPDKSQVAIVALAPELWSGMIPECKRASG
jgi:hypothetical protein